MIQRCSNPKLPYYENYGGRGITVCERWKTFSNFYHDMGQRPDGTSINRIDTNGNYEPSNCNWATRKEQQQNRKKYEKRNKLNKNDKVVAAKLYSTGKLTQMDLANAYSVSHINIFNAIHSQGCLTC